MSFDKGMAENYSESAAKLFETERRLNMLGGAACEVSQLYFARINLCRLAWGDIVLALKECKKTATWHDWDDWHACWSRRAATFEEQGKSAATRGLRVTAREALLRAAAAYHFAEFMYFSNPPVKNATRRKVTAIFDSALPYFEYPIRKVAIPHGELALPGYLLAPRPAVESFPCVILNNGMESAKEAELLAFAESFLARGMAVLLFDGPGQGEFLGHRGMPENWEAVIGSVLDFVEGEAEIDSARIGMFGVSFGGYLCMRGASFHQDRIKAAVNLSGCFDLDNFDSLRGMVLDDFTYVFQIDATEMSSLARERINLRGAPRLMRPLLTIHSRTDSLFPFETAQRAHDWAGGEKEFIAYDNEWHVCTNHMSEFVPLFCDWMRLKLDEQKRK